jgi:hypothetical protein
MKEVTFTKQPIKIIDDFFEAPSAWRHYGLKQEFTRDENSTWPGTRTETVDQLNEDLFHSLAKNIIKHIPGKQNFLSLQANFALVDKTYSLGWIHQDESKYNVAGIVYLNQEPADNSGTIFYRKIIDNDIDFNELFFKELEANPEDREGFLKYKQEQRTMFINTLTVHNVFNRCVLFSPDEWHSADSYFGETKDDSRLTINFFGYAT